MFNSVSYVTDGFGGPTLPGMELVWTRDGKQRTDTVHRAGCSHIRLAREIVDTLVATTVPDAEREMFRTFGVEDDPENQFVVSVAPCARGAI